jgi:tetratricopeptide (TPR) repeat protein
VWNNLGNALAHQRRHSEALTCYQQALQLRPGYDPSWNNLGNVLEEVGDLEAATRAYARAVSLEPRQPTYRFNLASVLARSGQADRAVEHLAVALRSAPDLRQLVPSFPEFSRLLSDPRLGLEPPPE